MGSQGPFPFFLVITMLKNMSMLLSGGNAPEELKQQVSTLITEFENELERRTRQLPPKIIRSKLNGSIFVICDDEKISVIYAAKFENRFMVNEYKGKIQNHQIINELSMTFDIDDFSIAIFPRSVLDVPEIERSAIIEAAITNHVNQQIEVFRMSERISAFSPIFGPNSFPVQNDLVFVLMPFEDELTRIYNGIVKETIEQDCRMVCRRADDIKSINPIIKDIWKSICEARIIIADLTGFNPNVMYELGIAHTVGKETLILYQDADTENKFPFDLAHIRRINYRNTATGGKELRKEISETLGAMISFQS